MLGAAIVVGAALGRAEVVLETAAGAVAVRLERVGERVSSGWMRQPIPSWSAFARRHELLAALGVERSRLPVEVYENGPRHVYVALAGEREVTALRPDLRALAVLGELGVSCFAGAGARWRTRMFAPGLGVPEDPATGSAAGPLAVHLSRHGEIAFGAEIEIRQGEEIARPSLLRGARARLRARAARRSRWAAARCCSRAQSCPARLDRRARFVAGSPAMRDAVICEPLRSPVGGFGGVFRDVAPTELAASVIRELLARTALPAAEIEDVILGQGYPTARRRRSAASPRSTRDSGRGAGAAARPPLRRGPAGDHARLHGGADGRRRAGARGRRGEHEPGGVLRDRPALGRQGRRA